LFLNHRLINLPDTPQNTAGIYQAFDEVLQKSLIEDTAAIAICLKPEMNAGVELLEWLVKWQRAFAGRGKRFFIVASTPMQVQYLELSHPDERLIYTASLDELFGTYPQFQLSTPATAPSAKSSSPPPASADAAAVVGAPAPEPSTHPAPPSHMTAVQPAIPFVQHHAIPPCSEAPSQKISGMQTVKISGEYACTGCGITRMYAKGDIAADCTNPECRSPKSGWKLVFELF